MRWPSAHLRDGLCQAREDVDRVVAHRRYCSHTYNLADSAHAGLRCIAWSPLESDPVPGRRVAPALDSHAHQGRSSRYCRRRSGSAVIVTDQSEKEQMKDPVTDRETVIWDQWAERDPLWFMLGTVTSLEGLMGSGQTEIRAFLQHASAQGMTFGRGCAIDFGCGVGRLTQALGEHFERAIGVDVSQRMVEQAQQYNRFDEKVSYVVVPATSKQLPFQDDSADLIYSVNTLFHIPPHRTKHYIMEFLRIMKPDGLMVFQVGRGSAVRRAVRAVVPEVVHRWRWHLRTHGHDGPMPSFFTLTRPEIERVIERAPVPGKLAHVQSDRGQAFPSYYVRRA